MQRVLNILVFFLLFSEAFPQRETSIYQKGLTADQNLKAIISLAPYSQGAIGFDNRYEGIKGSPRLFDTLLPSFLNIKGQDYYIEVEADLDLAGNAVLFIHPKTKKIMTVPAEVVTEIIFRKDEKEFLFRTSSGLSFEKEQKDIRFCQVLKDAPYPFIKITSKNFKEADYRNAYSPDRRYDEFETKIRYFMMGPDNIFHQVVLNKKSLTKLYPEKKGIIARAFSAKGYEDPENMVITLLELF